MNITEPLMTFKSHIEGRNADVAIYSDRIEWHRTGWLPGRKDTNMILVRQIQGITTRKHGLVYTKVRLTAGAAVTEFRCTKAQAAEVKETITRLLLAGSS